MPEGIHGLCCGTPWKSKGFTEGSAAMARRVVDALWNSTQRGALPVVVDASSCTDGLEGLAHVLPDDERVTAMRVEDAVAFTVREILPSLAVAPKAASLTLHPTCSTTHLGIGDDLRTLAEAVADEVMVPTAWGCCAFAGDRGMLHPELTDGGHPEEAADVAAYPTRAVRELQPHLRDGDVPGDGADLPARAGAAGRKVRSASQATHLPPT